MSEQKLAYNDIVNVLFSEALIEYTPEGVFFSRPVLGLGEGIISDHFFLYSYNRAENIVYAPYARIEIDAIHRTLIGYHTAEEMPFKNTLPNGMYKKKGTIYDDTFRTHEASCETAYMQIRDFVFAGNVSDEQRAVLAQYVRSLAYIIDKPAMPFYVELSPDFFAWITTSVKGGHGASL